MRAIILLLLICTAAYGSYSIDGDEDYIPDRLEKELAIKFKPVLRLDNSTQSLFYPTQELNIPFSAELYADTSGTLYIVISYGVLFTNDDGCLWALPIPLIPHAGDTEFCQVLLKKNDGVNNYSALQEPLYWHMEAVRSTAHTGAGVAEYDEYDLRYSQSAGPEVWVQSNKHGVYLSKIDCNQYPYAPQGCGDCDEFFFTDSSYGEYLQNLGSTFNANSPYIDRYIYDTSTSHWVNVWDGIDFPDASPLMGSKKFMDWPRFNPDFVLRLYQGDGNYTGAPTTITRSSAYPAPTNRHKAIMTDLSLSERDAIISIEIYNLQQRIRQVTLGRWPKGENIPARIWNTSHFPRQETLPNAKYWYRVSSFSNSADKMTTTNGTFVVNPSVEQIPPVITNVRIDLDGKFQINFDKPVNFTKNSIKMKDLVTGDFVFGDLYPPLQMNSSDSQSFSSEFEFFPNSTLSSYDSVEVWITQQDIYDSTMVAMWDYFDAPYIKIKPTGDLLFSDDFDGPDLNPIWTYHGDPGEYSIQDGILLIDKTNAIDNPYIEMPITGLDTLKPWAIEFRARLVNEDVYLIFFSLNDSTPPQLNSQMLQDYQNTRIYGYDIADGFFIDTDIWHTYRIVSIPDSTKIHVYVDGVEKSLVTYDYQPNRIILGDFYNSTYHRGDMYFDYIQIDQDTTSQPTLHDLEVTITEAGIDSNKIATVKFETNMSAYVEVTLENGTGYSDTLMWGEDSLDYAVANTEIIVTTDLYSVTQGDYYFKVKAYAGAKEDIEQSASFQKNIKPFTPPGFLYVDESLPQTVPIDSMIAFYLDTTGYDLDVPPGSSLTYNLNFDDTYELNLLYDTMSVTYNEHSYSNQGVYDPFARLWDGLEWSPEPYPTVQIEVEQSGTPEWEIVFQDNFDGTSLDSSWLLYDLGSSYEVTNGVFHLDKGPSDAFYIYQDVEGLVSKDEEWAVEWRVKVDFASPYFLIGYFDPAVPFNSYGIQLAQNSSTDYIYLYKVAGSRVTRPSGGFGFSSWHVYRLVNTPDDTYKRKFYFDGQLLSQGYTTTWSPWKVSLGDFREDSWHVGDYYVDYVKIERKTGGGTLLAGAGNHSKAAPTVPRTENESNSELVKGASLPKAFALHQNAPNPFNPSTSISYDIPDGKMATVSLKIYNLRGQLVTSLIKSEQRNPGRYTVFWDGNDSYGRTQNSGVYFYRFIANDYTTTKKMVLLK